MKSLSSLLSIDYTPTTPTDFIGAAKRAAILIDKIVAQRAPEQLPIKISLIGPPGVGKSMLCKFLWSRLNNSVLGHQSSVLPHSASSACSAVNNFDLHKFAGKDVDLERVRQIAIDLQYKPTSPYRLYWIDEADCMTPDALKRMLPLLDDVPKQNAFILTANSDLSKIEERFHTRFKLLELTGPTTTEIVDFLMPFLAAHHSPLSPPVHHVRQLKSIAEHCSGNVRAAIDDLDTYLLSQ
jgi:DNA polymerase III delta prime subunit